MCLFSQNQPAEKILSALKCESPSYMQRLFRSWTLAIKTLGELNCRRKMASKFLADTGLICKKAPVMAAMLGGIISGVVYSGLKM
jgi:hypothetical protein